MKAKTTITEADYLANLARTMTAKPPEGAFTAADVVERTGVPRNTTFRKLQSDVRSGVLATGMFTHKTKLTRFYWVAR